MTDNTPRILLVEDLPIAQKIALYALQACGCCVDVVDNGAAAIDAVQQHQDYDVIFMDLGLPDIDGLTVTETIRQTFSGITSRIPIIALTAHLDERIKQDSFRAGMTDYVVKPLTDEVVDGLLRLHVPKYQTEQADE